MPRPIRVRSETAILVDFDSACMKRYHETPLSTLRAAMEEIQRRLWGVRGGMRRFEELMTGSDWHPVVHLDDENRVPLWRNLKARARDAVVAYNSLELPMRFRADAAAIDHGHLGGSEESAVHAAADEPPPPPLGPRHTCVHWKWVNGEYVAVYNYTLYPEDDDEEHAALGVVEDGVVTPPGRKPKDYNLFDALLPGSGLIAKYQMNLSLRLKFPLREITDPAEHEIVSAHA